MSALLSWPRFSVAPMMDWTDRHCRYFLRQLSPRALLYTEMVTAAAVVRGDRQRLLRHDGREHPVALQLGGADPAELAAAAAAGEAAGYTEINLNCGCPSDRVSAGAFGAVLMQDPAGVARGVAAMVRAVQVPVTVKLRIGVVNRLQSGGGDAKADMLRFDAADAAALLGFCRQVRDAGAAGLIVHARKAVLGGLSPHDNRTIPPLRPEVVAQLRGALPGVPLAFNGGLRRVAEVDEVLAFSDSAMLGREAYHRPYVLAELQGHLYPVDGWQAPTPAGLLLGLRDYVEAQMAAGERLSAMTRHLLGLVSHVAGAREYRRLMSEGARRPGADARLLEEAARLPGVDQPPPSRPIAA
jgi:tRNA-dihydrouridine synthase A